MSADPVSPLEETLVTEREQWQDGPPHELFSKLRGQCPVHWTSKITEYPEEAGFWSVTTADDVHAVSRDWETYSSATGFTALTDAILPLELSQAMFIGMDPPKHDRLKALFQRGFTPKRISEHEPAIREITKAVLDRLEGRETCDLVTDVAQPVVARVIGSFMGTAPEDDEIWARLMNNDPRRGRSGPQPRGRPDRDGARRAGDLRALRRADRAAARAPDRGPDERPRPRRHRRREARGARDRHGLLPARGRGQRLHEGDLLQRHARDPGGPDAAPAAARRPVAGPRRGRGGAAHVPRLRALPAHGDARRRAQRRSRSARATRWSCGTSPPTATRRATRTRTASTSRATPSTRPSARAAGTSASAPRWRGWSCGS